MADVTNYEFQDLVDKIQNKLQSKPGWGDAYDSSVGQTIIDINAEAADILSYMLERRSQENFLSTARLRSSIVSNASSSGYRPRRAVASNGTLEIQLQDQDGNAAPVETDGEVIIPNNTNITFNNENFVSTDQISLTEGQDTVEIPIEQGTYEELTFNPNQEQSFIDNSYVLIEDYESIAERSIKVVSGGVEYQDIREVDESRNIGSLLFSEDLSPEDEQTGAYYDIRYTHDGMRIQFGNNNFGREPNEQITISFIRTKGEEVRVVGIGNRFELPQETLSDGLNVTPPNEYYYSLTNITQIVNGRAPESLEDIKINAPLSNTLNQRAVSVPGYNFWAKRSDVGGIIDANTFTERELNTLLFNLNNIYVSYLTETGQELSEIEKQEFIDFMKERDVALAHIIPIQADEIRLGMDINFKRNDQLPISNSELYQIIKNFLQNKFERREGSIGKDYQKSDTIRDFYDITTTSGGVEYQITDFVDIEINAYQDFTAPIQTNDVNVYMNPNVENTATAGDTFTLTIDGSDYTVSVESGDIGSNLYVEMLYKMRDELLTNTNLKSRVVTYSDGDNDFYILEIKTFDIFGTFVIENNTGDLQSAVEIIQQYQIIPKPYNPMGTEQNLLPGSISILDSSGGIVYEDDGDGFWVDQSGNQVPLSDFFNQDGVAEAPINYETAVVYLPSDIPNGDYTIKHKQDEYENFEANNAAAVTLINPKEDFEDEVETYTQIRFV